MENKDFDISDIKIDSHVKTDIAKDNYKSDFKLTDIKLSDFRRDKQIKDMQI